MQGLHHKNINMTPTTGRIPGQKPHPPDTGGPLRRAGPGRRRPRGPGRLQDRYDPHSADDGQTAPGWASVIARLDGDLTPAREAQLHGLQADVTRRPALIRSLELRVPARNLARLAALPFVTHLSADGVVRKCDEFTAEGSGAAGAWQQYGLTGQGVTVAVVDSGIGGNNDLQQPNSGGGNRIVAAVNFVPDHPGAPVPANGGGDANDHCGHGTHVAGIISGNGKSSSDDPNAHDKKFFRHFYGVAPGVSLVNVRVLDGQGGGTVGQVVAGLAVGRRQRQEPTRSAWSTCRWGTRSARATPPTRCARPWRPPTRPASSWSAPPATTGRLNGSINTPGLDNEGWGTAYGSIQVPGNDPYVITVGAMKGGTYDAHGAYQVSGRSGDRIATYSGRGPSRLDLIAKPDLVAPGNQIISTLAGGCLPGRGAQQHQPDPAVGLHGQGGPEPCLRPLLPPVGDLDGGAGGGGGGGTDASGRPGALAGHGEGPADGLGGQVGSTRRATPTR